MAAQARDPGALNAGAGAVSFGGGTVPADSLAALRQQRLTARHLVHPALAPIVAALAWEARP